MQGVFSLSQAVAVFRRVWGRFVGIVFIEIGAVGAVLLFVALPLTLLFTFDSSFGVVSALVFAVGAILIIFLSFFVGFFGHASLISVFVHDLPFLRALSFGVRHWYRLLVPMFLSSFFILLVVVLAIIPLSFLFSHTSFLSGLGMFLYLLLTVVSTASFVFLPFVWIDNQGEGSFSLLKRSLGLAWRRDVFLPLILVVAVFFALQIPEIFLSSSHFGVVSLFVLVSVFLVIPFFLSCVYVLYLFARGGGKKVV